MSIVYEDGTVHLLQFIRKNQRTIETSWTTFFPLFFCTQKTVSGQIVCKFKRANKHWARKNSI